MLLDSFGKIAVVGATGWMGRSILMPLLQGFYLRSDRLILFNRSGDFSAFSAWRDIECSTDLSRIPKACDTVFLSIKPHDLPNLNLDLSGQLLVSILAGTRVSTLFEYTQSRKIIRAMPNTASSVGGGFSPYYANDQVSLDEKKAFESLFSYIGLVEQVGSEIDIDRLTALTGSGHGWVAFFESAMIEAGIAIGLDPALSTRAVQQLFKGMGALVATESLSPKDTVQALVDYAGTTAAGLESMRELQVDERIVKSIEASFMRAKMNMTKG